MCAVPCMVRALLFASMIPRAMRWGYVMVCVEVGMVSAEGGVVSVEGAFVSLESLAWCLYEAG